MVNNDNKTIAQCELHCHTSYSWDCDVSPKQVVDYYVKAGVDVLAITDHNEIAGALEAQQIAPDSLRIIIGEEISSRDGHIIGLFLKEKIEPHLSAHETIQAIKKQGGLVLVPHAFDRIRGGLGKVMLDQVKGDIDFLEVFNARMLFPQDNVNALNYAKENGLASYVGSDAHTPTEYGNAVCTIEPFETQEEFIISLKSAQFTTRFSGVKVYVLSEWVKSKKRIKNFMMRK
jgi:predicted metal-dependent phosphoesterase TrpH